MVCTRTESIGGPSKEGVDGTLLWKSRLAGRQHPCQGNLSRSYCQMCRVNCGQCYKRSGCLGHEECDLDVRMKQRMSVRHADCREHRIHTSGVYLERIYGRRFGAVNSSDYTSLLLCRQPPSSGGVESRACHVILCYRL